jgi:hypothetical protein
MNAYRSSDPFDDAPLVAKAILRGNLVLASIRQLTEDESRSSSGCCIKVAAGIDPEG